MKERFGLHVVITDKRVFGPFKTGDDALRWGKKNIGHERGWVIRPLEEPKHKGELK